MEVLRRRQARANSVLPLRQGHVPQGPAAEHPAVEQGPGGDSEAGARRGVAVSDVDREPAAQVRDRAAQRNLRSGFRGLLNGNSPLGHLRLSSQILRFIPLHRSNTLALEALFWRLIGTIVGTGRPA